MIPIFPPLNEPLINGTPNTPPVSAGSVSYQLRKAWEQLPWKQSLYFRATGRTAKYFGLPLPKFSKRTLVHDLGVAGIALHYQATWPEQAKLWRGEDLMAYSRIDADGWREKLPDAFIVAADGQVQKVIEFATRNYDSPRIRAFEDDCRDRGIPAWEIWS